MSSQERRCRNPRDQKARKVERRVEQGLIEQHFLNHRSPSAFSADEALQGDVPDAKHRTAESNAYGVKPASVVRGYVVKMLAYRGLIP